MTQNGIHRRKAVKNHTNERMKTKNTSSIPILKIMESSIYLLLSFFPFFHRQSNLSPLICITLNIGLITALAAFILEVFLSVQYPIDEKKRSRKRENSGISMGSSLLSLSLLGVIKMMIFLEHDPHKMEEVTHLQLYCVLTSCSGMVYVLSHLMPSQIFSLSQEDFSHSTFSHLLEFWLSLGIVASQIPSNRDIQTLFLDGFLPVFLYSAFQLFGIYLATGRIKNSSKKSVFTLSLSTGEWKLILGVHSLLFTDYILRYIVRNPHFSSLPSIFLPKDYIAVSHAGYVGCVIGCLLSTVLSPNLSYANGIGVTVMTCAISALSFVEWTLQMYSTSDWSIISNSTIQMFVPKCILWILSFLLTSETNKDVQSFYELTLLPRGCWLIYWAILLTSIAPIIISLSEEHQAQHSILSSSNTISSHHYSVVISRKLFHFVAILLFSPCTRYCPSMMFLSYTIAICVLILVECLRLQHAHLVRHDSISTQKIKNTMNHLHTFYSSFLDEKEDTKGFLFTHVSLVFGCAMPLWIQKGAFESLRIHGSSSILWNEILPYIGILCLGVGDAFGAIVGTLYGRTRWSNHSKRTFEGSLGMLMSMIVSTLGLLLWFGILSTPYGMEMVEMVGSLIVLTILEACTDQIDNICLPFVGCISLLLFSMSR